MTPGLRRFAWSSFLVTEASLVAAATAYVGLGTREFWLVTAAAAVAIIAYAVTATVTREPMRGEEHSGIEGWDWFQGNQTAVQCPEVGSHD